jgi:hypothetical protein
MVAILGGGDEATQALAGYGPFRQALELERSTVYGKWSVIARVMGRGERHLLRQLAVLKLSDDALDLADRGRLTEGQLRPMVSVAPDTDAERQLQLALLITRYDLSGAEVARLVKCADLDAAENRIRRQRGLDKGPARSPTAIRRPSSIMIERLRGVRRLAARHEKGGLRVSDLLEEILASGNAEEIYQELDELTELLVDLRKELARSISRAA